MVEAFVMQGRVALTLAYELTDLSPQFSVFANGGAAEAAKVEAWHVGSIWTTPDQVREEAARHITNRTE
jgi:hypothetical protein